MEENSNEVDIRNVSEITPLVNDTRREFRNAIGEAVYVSYISSNSFIFILFTLCSAKLITCVTIFHYAKTDTDTPLNAFIIGNLIIDALFMLILGLKYLSNEFDCSMTVKKNLLIVHSIVGLGYFIWLVIGNYWFYTCDGCFDDAPLLTWLAFSLIFLGYMYFCMPVFLCIGMCICFPITLVVLLLLKVKVQKHASESLINKLKSQNFSPENHIGETACTICSYEFVEGDSIIVLPCDSRHFFHETCCKQWLRIKSACPYCRKQITEDNIN
ncbi:unnamed protein product [Blepharisma stoltei]|uniref:RING-type domain-containing protein n=1 Tax=Blepharisma stoltei TaxID=1481888 RepID=A0AAU9IWB1_9CILI|nr:unnamed protein product [Blepharisma stoltei]